MANKFVNGFTEAKWWAKILMAIVFIILFLLIINWLMKYMTHHGESLPVPKLKGLTYEEATRLLDEKDLRYVVFDSVYVPKAKNNEVVDQNPNEGSQVKRNRIIYLTINARPVPIVKMPDIKDLELREAISKMTAAGLEVGEIKAVPDISFNRVLEYRYKGKKITAGDDLEKGSKIDLTVTKGEKNAEHDIPVPDLAGLSLDEAKVELSLFGLNVGTVTYDTDVTDKGTALVYRQNPAPGRNVYTGKEIDLFLKNAE